MIEKEYSIVDHFKVDQKKRKRCLDQANYATREVVSI